MKEGLEAQLVKELVTEGYEALDQFDQELVILEKGDAPDETLNVMFRVIHTLKGSGGCLGFPQIESLAHAGESLMCLLRDRALQPTPEIVTELLACSDGLRAILNNLEQQGLEGSHDNARLIRSLKLLSELQAKADTREPAPYGIFESESEPQPYGLFDFPAAESEDPAGERSPKLNDALSAAPAGSGRPTPSGNPSEGAIRVDVRQLDGMMDLVGELVLARNQILQATGSVKDSTLLGATQRLNTITAKLQEAVMKTRMQPIGNIWSKYPRIVRDIARDLGKQVRLEMEGNETDLDRNIIEAIKDPLTHLVRNAVDHGLELPAERIAAGKSAGGVLRLRAFHEGGNVNIEVFDDGAGIDREKVLRKALEKRFVQPEIAAKMGDKEVYALLFEPGFSTTEKVTNISGRGVGLDVVKSNIEKIGGSVLIHSEPGRSTIFRIKIPLTLAIIPALMVSCGEHRYAIPQANLLELVRIGADEAAGEIEYVGEAPVYRLRGRLLPLVFLRDQLQVEPRPSQAGASVFLLVLQVEGRQFGLVVDAINDTEEIVVKPMGKELKNLAVYAGATIMGDGSVCLILDVLGVARRAGLLCGSENAYSGLSSDATARGSGIEGRNSMLLFSLGDGRQAAIALSHVARLEEFDRHLIESAADMPVIQYRGEIMPLISLPDFLNVHASTADPDDRLRVIVYSHHGRSVGFVVHRILDTVEEAISVKRSSIRPGILGSAVIRQRVTELIDTEAVIERSGVMCLEGDMA